jgi:hypothetical protein
MSVLGLMLGEAQATVSVAGVVIPAVVMIVSFLSAWWLYRRFSKPPD